MMTTTTTESKATVESNMRIGVTATPEEVYKALTRTERLAQWWTSDTRGNGEAVGEVLEFWFGKFCQRFEVKVLEPGKRVVWKATKDGMDEWEGTEVSFTLSTDDKHGQTMVRFRHAGWRANTDFFAHCSMKWSTFLMSFKDLMEKGSGRPAPHDVHIEHR